MYADDCPPNKITFNIFVRAFLNRGDTPKVKIFLQEMINRKFSVDPSTMEGLLTADGGDGEIFRMIQKLVPRDEKVIS